MRVFQFFFWPFRLLSRAIGVLARPFVMRVDSSPRLSRLINAISSSMATQRGVPILIGIGILLASWIAHGIVLVVLVSTDALDSHLYLLCIPFSLLHISVLAGFIGTLVAIPLGQGYQDKT